MKIYWEGPLTGPHVSRHERKQDVFIGTYMKSHRMIIDQMDIEVYKEKQKTAYERLSSSERRVYNAVVEFLEREKNATK